MKWHPVSIPSPLSNYEGCSNMNTSNFITFFTYMLRQNSILFCKELFVAFKMTPPIKKHSLYFSSCWRLYKGHACILKFFFVAKNNTRFGTCTNIVSYLCKFETKWHQILDAIWTNIHKVACRKCLYNPVQSRVNRHFFDVLYFIDNVILSNLLVM